MKLDFLSLLRAPFSSRRRRADSPFLSIVSSAAAAVDILIASALVFILSRAETSFKATKGYVLHNLELEPNVRTGTDFRFPFFFFSLLRRLMIHSVTTGSMTAGTAVIALAVFAVYPNDNVCSY